MKRKLQSLQIELTVLEFKEQQEFWVCRKDICGACSDDISLCVCDLVDLQLATDKVAEVIHSEAKHLFQQNIDIKDLPSKLTCVDIANEGAEALKKLLAEKIESEDG